jgi:predicted amidophosphoribosyltransferase
MTRLATALAALFFPEVCAHCDAAYGDEGHGGLCDRCARGLPIFTGPSCPLCARPAASRPVASGATDRPVAPSCRACRRAPPAWRRITILGSYEGPLAALIRDGKIAGAHSVLDRIAPLLLERITAARPPAAFDAVIAVPSDHRFAGLLADRLAESLSADRPEILFRVPGALRQVGLRRAARRSNARRALNRRDFPVPQSVLVVDDIMTTGATLHTAASLLREGGAMIVDALAVARAPLPGVRHSSGI